ncbi:CheR family methyltransferase [Myxosarcina sp. GI1]|uniref:CheR family methyltransferase n=1 Tax=Myxosarcina sp. GI1 TaxID=1541065 RepID=UPI00055E0C03|nr:CheR family methyltransferase [Myxosarcina sp. GI1]
MNEESDRVFEEILEYLRQARGFDFTGYKRSSLKRRVVKQMNSRNIDSFEAYLDYLQVHQEEFLPLFNTILINVTSFFRDADAWNFLRQQALSRIIADKSEPSPIRVWCAGCASGEEAYSLAIILADILGLERFRQQVKIYATDVDEDALAQARTASYSAEKLEPIETEIRERFFEPLGERYIFRSDLRRAVIFGRHDLVQDAPISRLDLLVCRNTLMYFNAETQAKILSRFHFALNDSGLLFLGKAEMLLTHANLFSPINLQYRIFRRVKTGKRRDRSILIPNSFANNANDLSRYVQLRELALNSVATAFIVIDINGNLSLANTTARSMFGLNFIDIGRPLQDLEISYRPLELRSHLDKVYQERQKVTVNDVVRQLPNDDFQYLDVEFCLLQNESGEILGTSVTFADTTRYHQLQEELQQANQELETANEELQSSNEELETTNEELQSTNEELETTNEELQSTNEELETTNEELQSTNEELETMNEELQSTNEELQTINDELRLRTTELNQTNAFLGSILGSLQAGVVVVDRQFNILSWNDEAENLWGLRADEVRNKSVLGLDIGLPVAQLREPILDCLNEDKKSEDITLQAINRRGKSFQCRISFNLLIGFQQERQGVILMMEVIETNN